MLEQQRVQGVMDVGDVVVLGLEVVDVVVLVVLVVEEEVLGVVVEEEVLGVVVVVEQVEVLVVLVVEEVVVEEVVVVVAVAVVVADADDDDAFSPVHLGHLPPVHPLLEDLRLHPLVPCVKRIYNDVYACCYKIKNN